MSQTTITLLFLAFAVISFILEKIPLGLTASILSNTGTAAALGGNLSIIGAPGNLMGVNALQEMEFFTLLSSDTVSNSTEKTKVVSLSVAAKPCFRWNLSQNSSSWI